MLESKNNKYIKEYFNGTIKGLEYDPGKTYFAVPVEAKRVASANEWLKGQIGEEKFEQAKAAKDARDGVDANGESIYHITIVRPPEMEDFSKNEANKEYWDWRRDKITEYMQNEVANKINRTTIIGVGKLEDAGKTAYFGVVESAQLQGLRSDLDEYLRVQAENANVSEGKNFTHIPLSPFGLHVTLGFEGGDVHNATLKDKETLKNWEK